MRLSTMGEAIVSPCPCDCLPYGNFLLHLFLAEIAMRGFGIAVSTSTRDRGRRRGVEERWDEWGDEMRRCPSVRVMSPLARLCSHQTTNYQH